MKTALTSASANALFSRIEARLGSKALAIQTQDKAAYEHSARHFGGAALAVAQPATLSEMSWLVKELVGAGVHIVPQGAATGLVAGATPSTAGTQCVLSTRRLRDVMEVDPVNRSATVAAGYLLSDLNRAALEHGLYLPIDLGADPSIGGMVATNTGGARLLRYGGMRENLLDCEAVLVEPAGLQVGGGLSLRKNNTGLSWPQLMCGTFGAYGIVARATVKLHPLPRQRAVALLAVESAAVAMQMVCSIEDCLGEWVSACEGISGAALGALSAHPNSPTLPFSTLPPYALLVEVASSVPPSYGVDVEAQLLAWLELQWTEGRVLDAAVDKPEQLWRIRHALSEAVQHRGRMVAFDLSVSRSRFAAFRDRVVELAGQLVPGIEVCDFGHLGDGGVHLNMVVPDDCSAAQIQSLRDAVYDEAVNGYHGSFSAEHGIGPSNHSAYKRLTSPAVREWACVLHGHFDPTSMLGNVRLD